MSHICTELKCKRDVSLLTDNDNISPRKVVKKLKYALNWNECQCHQLSDLQMHISLTVVITTQTKCLHLTTE